MATTNLAEKTLGGILWQTGNGTPNHTAPKAAHYVDLNGPATYVNQDGATAWGLQSTLFSKYDATTAPTPSNDNTEGFQVGSTWVDLTNDKAYVCLDASTGAAVWNLTNSAGVGIATILTTMEDNAVTTALTVKNVWYKVAGVTVLQQSDGMSMPQDNRVQYNLTTGDKNLNVLAFFSCISSGGNDIEFKIFKDGSPLSGKASVETHSSNPQTGIVGGGAVFTNGEYAELWARNIDKNNKTLTVINLILKVD